jgi:hypothetical protein
MENWIQDTTERFSKTADGVPNAQLEFERRKESKMRAFLADFINSFATSGADMRQLINQDS